MIRVITIEREFGCGAGEIARSLSDRLGWRLWDQLLTQEIARLAHCQQSEVRQREERLDPLYYRLLKSFALGSYEGSPGAPVEMLDADSIVRISEHVVQAAASAGDCVVVGRGSQHFLRARKDTLRFFLYAPREKKIEGLISEGKTRGDAEMLVDTVDEERGAFIKKYFRVDWPDRSVYHAMFNTALGDETVIRAILSLVPEKLS